ncbi:MAG: glutathione peroxidase [Sphingomonas sp.]
MTTLANIPLKTIDGGDSTLGDYAGKVLLVVNVASKCGLTPQYAKLEALYRTYRDQGFEVLGFPANDFKEQEPGTEAEIADFCATTYDVDFPLFAKVKATGEDRHPLYTALITAQPDALGGDAMRERLRGYGIETTEAPEIGWNFEKFLIGRDGSVVGRFTPDTEPDDDRVRMAIERELHASE